MMGESTSCLVGERVTRKVHLVYVRVRVCVRHSCLTGARFPLHSRHSRDRRVLMARLDNEAYGIFAPYRVRLMCYECE